MTTDPYAQCPCGSGKKFKWCCQPIYAGINRALEQDANGQHEAALKTIDDVTREHAGNPEAWGQKAKLLYANGKVEEAEEALQRAFALNANYPYGLLLRALFRFHEGEFGGALLLARRAAEAYDPEAHDYLAQIYGLIFECEMKHNRPVAAHAALRLAARYQPADEDARAGLEAVFGKDSRLPEAARRDYALMSPPAGAGPRRAAWDQALQSVSSPRLGDVAHAFEALAQQDDPDAPAWFNLGLARAWLGDNAAALEALDRYLELEADEPAATPAATLQEVLRLGRGLEEQADYHDYSFALRLTDPKPVEALLQEWAQAHRLVPVQTGQEGVFVALVLELSTASLITVGRPAADAGHFAGYLSIVGNVFQVHSPLQEPFERLRDEVRQRLAVGLGELHEHRGPGQFQDVTAEALLFPMSGDEQQAKERVLAHARTYFEEKWVQRPRHSLTGNTPLDAAGHATLRKKLRGVIEFIEQCARLGMLSGYDFNGLRRKLGLQAAAPAQPAADGAAPDVSGMGAAELAALKAEGLTEGQLEQALQAAQKLDAQELAANFARALVARPPSAERPDRYPVYSFLTQRALQEGDKDAALDYVNEGERVDCEHNGGRRRNDYELRRGQVHVKRGEAEAAQEVFQRLIERVPSELRYRGSAAEAMLALKQGDKALRFAEEGLAAARQANDRDSEQYLQELADAARKQMR
jgi:tetratricopeptide (TPR) repeat protein